MYFAPPLRRRAHRRAETVGPIAASRHIPFGVSHPSVPPRSGPFSREARRLLPRLKRWREEFHRDPELANEERRTRDRLVRSLGELGIPATTYPDFTGVLGVIGRDRRGPVVAVRADMEALPVTEATGLPFTSTRRGRMHACGHDVHMTCLLGAAALLARRSSLAGPVKLIFQPAEEDGERGGAAPFLERGAFDDPPVDYVLGQHVEPGLPLGSYGWRKGPIMAAADRFRVTVLGRGGHAAYPHRGPDAILAAAEIVAGLPALVSRVRDPLDPVVVSVGSVHGGTRHNILPDEVVIEGTVRTLSPGTRDLMERAFRRRVRALAAGLGARVRIVYRRGYPVTVNSPAATEVVVSGLAEEFGERAVRELERPVLGAEDFSRYLERVPGTLLFLGTGTAAAPATLHSATFAPTDAALVMGSAGLAAATVALQGA